MKSTTLVKCVASLLAVVMFSSTIVVAQEEGGRQRGGQRGGREGGSRRGGGGFGFGGRGFGGGGAFQLDKATLLRAEKVREELKIAEDQVEFVQEVIDSHQDKTREMLSSFANFREMSDEERAKAMEAGQKKREALTKETEELLKLVLSEDQSTRLDQIALQLRGTGALNEDKVAAKLKLDEDQRKKIENAIASQREKQQKMFEEMRSNRGEGGGFGGFEGMREKMEALRDEMNKTMLAALTEDQKKQFDEMKGKPFEVDRRELFGGFSGRGSSGRGDRRGGGGERRGGDRPRRPDAE